MVSIVNSIVDFSNSATDAEHVKLNLQFYEAFACLISLVKLSLGTQLWRKASISFVLVLELPLADLPNRGRWLIIG